MAKRTPGRAAGRDDKFDLETVDRDLFVLQQAYDFSDGHWHSHDRAQLVHAAEGLIQVQTATGRWLTPPQRAIWVPAGVEHTVESKRPFRLLTLYVRLNCPQLARQCQVVAVDRLVAELLEAAVDFGPDYTLGGAEERLLSVILDRLPLLKVNPLLHLPRPTTQRLRQVTEQLEAAVADKRSLNDWAAQVALTPKTFARSFERETQMTFGRWRQQLRLIASLELLGQRKSVTETAFEVGYDDASSYIASFKAHLGVTPSQYFRDATGS